MRHRLLLLALFAVACLAPRPGAAQSAADREAAARARLQAGRADETLPPRPGGARPPEDYRTLTTPQLAERCLGLGFGVGLGSMNDNRNRIGQLRRQNPAVENLFRRPDLWQGVLHVYDVYAKTLAVDPPTRAAGFVGINLNYFDEIYNQPELQAQLRGRERLFLKANLDLMRLDRRRLVGRIAAEPDSNMSLDLGRIALRLAEKLAPTAAALFKAVPDKFSSRPTAPELLKYNDRVLEAFGALAPLYPDSPDPVALVKRIGAENLDRDAEKTWRNAAASIPILKTDEDIPRQYWAASIGDLHPEAVYYLGGVNIAVVLKSGPRGEEGLVFMAAISNIIPLPEHIGGGSLTSLGDAAPGHISGSISVYTRPGRHAAQGSAVPE